MENKKISTAELDFDQIKSNLKEFLRGQDKISYYDFEGSGMSILLDILAYNTHYNALYSNLAVNESFLDSASKRNNVVSLAKMLGYIPDSASSPSAVVDVTVSGTDSTPATIILPRYTPFETSIGNETYRFYTLGDNIAEYNSATNSYTFSNLNIKEGTPLIFKYTVSSGQRYIIPNRNVDLSTLRVRVQENSTSSVFVSYSRQEDLLSIGSNDTIYFVKEIEGELYELEFGNDVVGKALSSGNIITMEYISSDALDRANGARVFSYQGTTRFESPSTPSGVNGSVTVIAKDQARNGYDKEDIETIRYNAPRAYITQNRGVTVTDYRNLVLSLYGEAESVNVWGGEDNVPPVYGKVFLAIKPKSSAVLTTFQKEQVTNLLKSRNVVSITPEIVDPDYIDMEIDISVYYNPRLTNKSVSQLRSIVSDTILNYGNEFLDSFDGIFRYSNFSTTVDNADESFISNISRIILHRQIEPKYNIQSSYVVELGNPIYHSGVPEQSIVSNGFYLSGFSNIMFLEDFPNPDTKTGFFRIYYLDTVSNKIYLSGTYGNIVYDTGSIQIDDINITGLVEDHFNLLIKPQSNDVVSVRNQLVKINEEDLNINIIVDRVSAGDAAGNSSYIFTSSRS